MKAVWRFDFPASFGKDEVICIMEMPKDIKIVRVAHRADGGMTIWAEVKPDAVKVPHSFQIFATGGLIPPLSEHVSTWQDGVYIWHLYHLGHTPTPLRARLDA